VGALSITDNNVIANGVVINVSFTIKSIAGAGQIMLTNMPSASDPSGNPVTVAGAAGMVTVISQLPALNLGTASGAPGATVTIPMTLANVPGANISAVGMDIGYDPTILANPNATIGPAGSAAGKSVIKSTPSTGVFRVGALSITDNNLIADGIVINVTFTIKSTAAQGQITLTNTPSASNQNGDAITVTGTNGTITVINTRYTLTTNITGKGTITNIEPNGPTFSCDAANCTNYFDVNSLFTLHATPSSGYIFNNWTDCADVNGNGDCVISGLNGNTSISAIFSINPLVQVDGLGFYNTIQDAYATVVTNSVAILKARNVTFEGPFTFDSPVNITIKGGLNSDFATVSDYTYLHGILTLMSGSLTAEYLVIK
jgi:hypothetical protein